MTGNDRDDVTIRTNVSECSSLMCKMQKPRLRQDTAQCFISTPFKIYFKAQKKMTNVTSLIAKKTNIWTDVRQYCTLPNSTFGHRPPPSCLNTSDRYRFWCSPGCSTSLPHPEKSSSSSCSRRTRRKQHPALPKLWTPPTGLKPSKGAAACRRPPFCKGSEGLPATRRRRRRGEESECLWALRRVARSAGCPPL